MIDRAIGEQLYPCTDGMTAEILRTPKAAIMRAYDVACGREITG